ncbi:MAG: selenide, water dikinase SelD [Syntrophus sp. (in: bacteria)]|nr:selenide, water dikinase SelD [Syntrophus sp. (in: bacteria)]
MGPEDLHAALQALPLISHPNLIAGMENAEDAGVYRLTDDLAIVQTLDFFTPIVDDPYTFGQVAAVNALSDVYAMGGQPLTAMNIVCFPVKKMDIAILQQILLGGLSKMREAGVTLVGGHSVEDDELKYGLSVTGVIHPQKVLLNRGGRPGDRLILTKPIGTGIVSTAVKAGMAGEGLTAKSIRCMTTLNKIAAELMTATSGVHACTDVTGFGFLGHACEMVQNSGVGMAINAAAVPFFAEIRDLVEDGIIPAGLHRNRNFRLHMIDRAEGVPDWLVDILFDPQTAGGLLISLGADQAQGLVTKMHAQGLSDAAIVGEIVAEPAGRIQLL